MIQGCLTFYGTYGPFTPTLEIDRTAPIDLTLYFKELFHRYNERIAWRNTRVKHNAAHPDIQEINRENESLDRKCMDISDKLSTFTFKMEDFYSMMLYEERPEDVSRFILQNVKDPSDYGNEAMIKKLERFKDEYSRIYFHYSQSRYFFVEPLDNTITPKEIHEIMKPSRPEIQTVSYDFYKLNPETTPDGKTIKKTTLPYPCRYEIQIEKLLQKKVEDKRIIRVYSSPTYDLNIFRIIAGYRLPTDHLDISLK